jgi:hypothetical protein
MEGVCELCGEPMPPGEEMFKFHGYSGNCPKPPLLQPFQQRVVEEKRQLDDKFGKIADFIQSSPAFLQLDAANQSLLLRQQSIMAQYSEIRAARIKLFKGA